MNNLQVLKYENHEIRTVTINDEPWWVGKDVCLAFGDTNYRRSLLKIDNDEKGVSQMFTPGGKQNMTVINEPGLYSLLFTMEPQKANMDSSLVEDRIRKLKRFKRWVTHEVLPSIRKNGMYARDELLDNPDLLLDVITKLKKEREERLRLEAQVISNRPKIVFADAVAAAQSSILIGELAKLLKQNGIEMGQNRLFIWMRNNGYLIKRKGLDYNMPTGYSMEKKLFTIKESSISHADGHISVSKTPKITGVGQQFFMNLFLQER
jgi:anti-repressor protein